MLGVVEGPIPKTTSDFKGKMIRIAEPKKKGLLIQPDNQISQSFTRHHAINRSTESLDKIEVHEVPHTRLMTQDSDVNSIILSSTT